MLIPPHVGHDRLDSEEYAFDIDIETLIEFGLCYFLRRLQN